jgi:hypothetical protein
MATTTQQLLINSKTFTALSSAAGDAVQVQNLGPTSGVVIVVSDSQPAVGTPGFVLRPGPVTQFGAADASSLVWAAALGNSSATIAFNPIVA